MCAAPSSGDFLCPVKEQVALTWGDWEVLGRHGSNVSVAPSSGCSSCESALQEWKCRIIISMMGLCD